MSRQQATKDNRNMPTSDAEDALEQTRAQKILSNLGFCGHYLHFHSGGQSGKAPILCLLSQQGEQMSQLELGSYFDLKPGSLSEILAKLETSGLIERTRNPKDRRQLFVRLTEKGAREAEHEHARRHAFRARAFDCLTDEEQDQLLEMLDKIRVRWEELDD